MFEPRQLSALIRSAAPDLEFTVLDIGAVPIGELERYHVLPELFPGSRIIGLEVDPEVCERLNREAPAGLEYHCAIIGRADEERMLYVTRHPVCTSLYEPNEALLRQYNDLEIALLKTTMSVQTTPLDQFVQQSDIGEVDFIKIDIQGAELEAFEGGIDCLGAVVAIVSEVEFLPHYVNQPLFGEVCEFLATRGFMFHRFLNLGGSTLKPFRERGGKRLATQDIWADAFFMRDPARFDVLTPTQLLKLAFIANIYASIDVAVHCLQRYDERAGATLRGALEKIPRRA